MNRYDILIIGGGPAGLTCGIYAARGRMKTLLLEKMVLGGQVASTDWVENYPGFPQGIAGSDLVGRMEEQARKFGLEIASGEVMGISKREEGEDWLAKTKDKEYQALSVIVATGAQPAKLNIPGEQELQSRGVSYCATCDGPLFGDQDVLVIGGGDTAITEALFLAKFASRVTVIHRRDRLRASKILQEKALSHPGIEFAWNSTATEVMGKDRVSGVMIKDVKTNKQKEIPASGLFIFIGLKPNTSFLKNIVDLDEAGFIITGAKMKTSKEGIYAAGDVRSGVFRQIATACGDGAIVALSAQHYVEELKGVEY